VAFQDGLAEKCLLVVVVVFGQGAGLYSRPQFGSKRLVAFNIVQDGLAEKCLLVVVVGQGAGLLDLAGICSVAVIADVDVIAVIAIDVGRLNSCRCGSAMVVHLTSFWSNTEHKSRGSAL
jgi:hypothetical protein